MDNKTIIQVLTDITKTIVLTEEQENAIKSAVAILEDNHSKEQLVEAIKLIASLLSIGSKFFDT